MKYLLLSIAILLPSPQGWRSKLRSFQPSFSPPGVTSGPRTGAVRRSGAVVKIMIQPPKGGLKIDGTPANFTNSPILMHGRTYVPLREFVEELKARYGLSFAVDFDETSKRADLRLVSQKALPGTFAAGLENLWKGDVATARSEFAAASQKPNGQDAKEMAEWLNPSFGALGETCVIRFRWYVTPETVEVRVEDTPVMPGTLIVLAPEGKRKISVLKDGEVIGESEVDVRHGRATVIDVRGPKPE